VQADNHLYLTVDDVMVALAKAIVRFENGKDGEQSDWYLDHV